MKKNYVGIREARINLSKLLRDVKSGMEIIITDRGTPVARLIPAESAELTLEERVKNFESCGLIEAYPEQTNSGIEPIELPKGFMERCLGRDQPDE